MDLCFVFLFSGGGLRYFKLAGRLETGRVNSAFLLAASGFRTFVLRSSCEFARASPRVFSDSGRPRCQAWQRFVLHVSVGILQYARLLFWWAALFFAADTAWVLLAFREQNM